MVDLDQLWGFSNFKQIVYDKEDGDFYLLANKKNGIIGLYLMKFSEKDPHKCENLTLDGNGLNIGDVSIFILRTHDEDSNT